jgi:hypothetical protein
MTRPRRSGVILNLRRVSSVPLCEVGRGLISMKASATTDTALSQISTAGCYFVPAVTETDETRMASEGVQKPDDHQSTKSLPRKVRASRSTKRRGTLTLISSLLPTARPPTILGRIGPVVVDALQCHFSRRIAHVCEKILERHQPTLADRYPTAAVVPKLTTIGIKAASLHRCPASVDGGEFFPNRMAVSSVLPSRADAAATRSVTATQIIADGEGFFAAIASAFPKEVAVSCVRAFHDGKTAKSLSGYVDASHEGAL